MRTLTVLLAGFVIASAAGCASASGVVLTETQQAGTGTPHAQQVQQTIMIQGHQQKMIDSRYTSIVNLDKGMMYRLDPAKKSYIQVKFPPPMPQAMGLMTSLKSTMALKKSGATRTVVGYKCADYVNREDRGIRQVTITECLSEDAPGAKTFTAFQQAMAAKLKGTGAKMPAGKLPEGIPLLMEAKVKYGPLKNPRMKPDRLAKLNAMLAKRPPMIRTTTVTKIEAKNLPLSTFEIPAGYTKQARPMSRFRRGMPPMMPHPKPQAAPAAHAAAPTPAGH
ncbi:MAG: hypothetical protein ACREQI_13300 [Candidatus Binataceae bacterium]